jgi:hypothetical protein
MNSEADCGGADELTRHELSRRELTSLDQTSEETRQYLIQCELALLDPAVRRDRAQVEALLAADFQEFGSSGNVWSRQTIVDSLAGGDYDPPLGEEMQCNLITADVALVTYRSVRIDEAQGTRAETLRSSLWVRESDQWRVRFHQGTKSHE